MPTGAIQRTDRIFVAGHQGMVGSAIVRRLQTAGFDHLITRTHEALDLSEQAPVATFFENNAIDVVVVAAAKVGGIHANNHYPAEFIYQNLVIECNVVHQAYRGGVRRLLFLGSSCIYPRLASQPMAERALLTGPLEATNEPYAIAKIAGIKLCESYNRQYGTDYRSVMPTNLYGPKDNYHDLNGHVIPALIKRFHQAKAKGLPFVEVWGTGRARREFLYVDDLADACLFVLQLDSKVYQQHTEPMCTHVNVGTGSDLTIAELAELVRDVVGYAGDVRFDSTQPDGTPRKLLDVSLLSSLGWHAKTPLREGLIHAYRDFLANHAVDA